MGAFFSLMSTTFAYEDPLSRTWQQATMNTSQKTAQIFKDMGKGMWRGGKGFGTVGALYAGSECVIEGVRGTLLAFLTSLPVCDWMLILTHVPCTPVSSKERHI